jgi:hypothetical protein
MTMQVDIAQRSTRSLQGSNAGGNASAYGPSVAEIRNVEIQKNTPAEEVVREEHATHSEEKPADEDEQAA